MLSLLDKTEWSPSSHTTAKPRSLCGRHISRRCRSISSESHALGDGACNDGAYNDGAFNDGAFNDGACNDGAFNDGAFIDGANMMAR